MLFCAGLATIGGASKSHKPVVLHELPDVERATKGISSPSDVAVGFNYGYPHFTPDESKTVYLDELTKAHVRS